MISQALVKIMPIATPPSALISMPASLNHNLINLNSTRCPPFFQMNACLYPAVFGANVADAGRHLARGATGASASGSSDGS